jgi:imidazolonepropionase-like amidohydrolase
MRRSLLSLFAVMLATAASVPAQSTDVAIKAGRLIDGRGGMTRNATITVTGRKIAAVGTGKQTVTYDLSRYTVLPGLIDVHDHIGWHFNKDDRFHTATDGETPADEAFAAAGNAYTT